MRRAYKTELDLNNKQRTLMVQHCGVARFVFNWALSDRIERYEHEQTTNMFEQKKRFNSIKDSQFPWVKSVSYKVVESALANCDAAYKNFFRQSKSGEKHSGFPKFKSRKTGLGSFTLRGCIHIYRNAVKLPVIGIVRIKETGYLPVTGVKVVSVTISARLNHWFISIQVEESDRTVQRGSGVIGVDLGIKALATCSNGRVFENPKPMHKYERQLAHIQREMNRRQKGSHNRNKTRQKLARLHYRISNVRRFALNEVSSYLVKAKPETIVLEDLSVSAMRRNRHLGKAVTDASFAELRRQLEYKCQWNGIGLVVADRFYPSSKTCSICGNVKPLLKLSERTYVCEKCGTVIDRDFNASLNLARLAQ